MDASIDKLCWAIVKPKNREFVDALTPRSLLGFSPIGDKTVTAWRDAVFRTALANGPGFLDDIAGIAEAMPTILHHGASLPPFKETNHVAD